MPASEDDIRAAGKPYAKWRMFSLIGIHLLFLSHFIHWKLAGRTLAPLELNEVLYTIHQGILTAGFVLMAVIMVGTLIFGRFFCSWGCHILALQDLSAAILKKLNIRPVVIRSRTLVWIPMAVMFYMFIWPQLLAAFHGVPEHELRVVTAESGGWASFITDSPWRNLPPMEIALFTFFICGFLIVFLLGSRAFCFMGCPYGALFSVADQFAPGRIALTGNCTDCGICTAACSSDILVHKEIQQHGMVTNPRCLKDMDCVSVCPENALSFAFRKPPMFRKGHPLGRYPERNSLTVKEDLLLLVSFVLSVFTFRGLYDAVPLLLSVGLAACVAMVVLILYRVLRAESYSLHKVLLRSQRKWTMAGRGFVAFSSLVLLLVLHSSVVQVLTYSARADFEALNTSIAEAKSTSGSAERIRRSISSYENVFRIGFVQPIDLKKELANLYLLNNEIAQATAELEDILHADPNHVEAGYRLAEIRMKQGNKNAAIALLNAMTTQGEIRPHTNDVRLMANAHLKLGRHHLAQRNNSAAEEQFKRAIELDATLSEPHIALGHLAYQKGIRNDALQHFEKALALGNSAPVVLNNLAAIHAMEGRNEQAIRYLQKLTLMNPNDSDARYRIGLLASAKGDVETALINLSKAHELDPGNTNINQALERLQKSSSTQRKNTSL